MSISIKPIDQAHYKGLMKLAKAFIKESLSDYGFVFEEDKLFTTLIAVQKTSFVLLEDNKVIGVLAGTVGPNHVDSSLVYTEIIWYVTKKRRKYGLRLLKYIEKYCKKNDIPNYIVGYMGNLNSDKMQKFYEKRGFELFQVMYIKRI